MPPGDEPSAIAFSPANVQSPPHPNPEAWWLVGDAIEHAIECIMNSKNYGKEPWIKTGDLLFTPTQIRVFYKTIQGLRRNP